MAENNVPFDEDFDDELEVITMVDEDGNEHDFIIVDALSYNDFNYILVVDTDFDEEDEEQSEALIFKEVEVVGDESVFDVVEDEEEFATVAKLFNDNEDFDISLGDE
ncbi:MAG: DUF1292 domain-containing protein [Lachnospirales bacterium]